MVKLWNFVNISCQFTCRYSTIQKSVWICGGIWCDIKCFFGCCYGRKVHSEEMGGHRFCLRTTLTLQLSYRQSKITKLSPNLNKCCLFGHLVIKNNVVARDPNQALQEHHRWKWFHRWALKVSTSLKMYNRKLWLIVKDNLLKQTLVSLPALKYLRLFLLLGSNLIFLWIW